MKNLFRFNHNKDKKTGKNIFLSLAQHSFILIFVLFLVSLVVGGFIYYKYLVLLQGQAIDLAQKPVRFHEDQLRELLSKQQEREVRLNAVDSQEHRDLFRL